jgi:hypothetical protein
MDRPRRWVNTSVCAPKWLRQFKNSDSVRLLCSDCHRVKWVLANAASTLVSAIHLGHIFGIHPPQSKTDFAMSDRTFIRHVVLFSAKDQGDVARIVDGLSLLKNIPHASTFEVVQNNRVDALSGEIDVVVYAEFTDDAALQAYKAHQIYQDAIAIVRPLRDMRIAADF